MSYVVAARSQIDLTPAQGAGRAHKGIAPTGTRHAVRKGDARVALLTVCGRPTDDLVVFRRLPFAPADAAVCPDCRAVIWAMDGRRRSWRWRRPGAR
jgi:hypothetical protein